MQRLAGSASRGALQLASKPNKRYRKYILLPLAWFVVFSTLQYRLRAIDDAIKSRSPLDTPAEGTVRNWTWNYEKEVNTSTSEVTTVGTTTGINDGPHIRNNNETSCRRSCPHYNNRIIIETKQKAGLRDRTYIMRAWANMGAFLCAQVLIPPPSQWLLEKHSQVEVGSNATFEDDFLYFAAEDDPEQIILSDTIDLNEPEGGWGNTLDSIVRKGDQYDRVIDHFYKMYRHTVHQQLGKRNRPFLWKVQGMYHYYNMEFLKVLYQLKSNGTLEFSMGSPVVIPQRQLPKWERYQDDLCVYATKVEAASINATARRVLKKLKDRFSVSEDGPFIFGYLHLRRGDSKKTSRSNENSTKCDTHLPKMERYLNCTFSAFCRGADLSTMPHCSERAVPVLIGSDERDKEYRRDLFSLVNDVPGIQAVDLDSEVLGEIEREIAAGEASPQKRNNYSVYLISLVITQDAAFYLRQHRVWCNECDADLVAGDLNERSKGGGWWSSWLPVDWPTGLTYYQRNGNPFYNQIVDEVSMLI